MSTFSGRCDGLGWFKTGAFDAGIAIRDGLVWLEEDRTDAEIAEQLIEQGIARERIVLGFQAPYKRGLHGFATG